MNTFKKKFVFTYHKIILIILLGVSSVSLGAGPVPEYYLGKINETEHFRNKYFEICSQFYFQHPMIFINLSFRKNLLLINFINFCIMFFFKLLNPQGLFLIIKVSEKTFPLNHRLEKLLTLYIKCSKSDVLIKIFYNWSIIYVVL